MNNLRRLESIMDTCTFFGRGVLNQMEVTMEFSPGRYDFISVPPQLANMGISSTKIKFRNPYIITEIRTGTVTSQRKLSNLEMQAVENKGSLAQYLWADPRYALKFAADIQQTSKHLYTMRIYDPYAKKREQQALEGDPWDDREEPYLIAAEMHFRNNSIRKMKIRESMADGYILDEWEIDFSL